MASATSCDVVVLLSPKIILAARAYSFNKESMGCGVPGDEMCQAGEGHASQPG